MATDKMNKQQDGETLVEICPTSRNKVRMMDFKLPDPLERKSELANVINGLPSEKQMRQREGPPILPFFLLREQYGNVRLSKSDNGENEKPITVIKRNGKAVPFDKTELVSFLDSLCKKPTPLDTIFVDTEKIARATRDGLHNDVRTQKILEHAANKAADYSRFHPDYSILAGRLVAHDLHRSTDADFLRTATRLRNYVNSRTKLYSPLISQETFDTIKKNTEVIQKALNYDLDFEYDYFAWNTLKHSYLLKIDGEIVERPQQMLMRVSLGLHGNDIHSALETYDLMSKGYFTHASPTLFNSGTEKPQMSSCFLVQMKDDSIEGICDTIKECALISKSAGGVGLAVHKIRSSGTYIRGTNGESNGLVPMLRVFNDLARYVDQGGGKRKGAFAVYLEPWHADIVGFLELRRNVGKEELRARDLNYGLWINDLFMERVSKNQHWSLFCPHEAPGLDKTWGEEFEGLYVKYEKEGRAKSVIKAADLWHAILESLKDNGNPYMLYKDSSNRKSNHQHLGTISCSNLCTEIHQYSSPDETAVCNLASIAVVKFVVPSEKTKENPNGMKFDFERLGYVTSVATKNLNKVIDRSYYPTKAAETSNLRHRPMGIGVQGVADMFAKMGIAFDSDEAEKLLTWIFETIYYYAIKTSNEISKKTGIKYPSFDGSPMSKGIFQFDMWKTEGKSAYKDEGHSKMYDWDALKKNVMKHGLTNSLFVAPMPTASTSNILGNNECFEPFSGNMYVRKVLSGNFLLTNKWLVRDLIKEGLWNKKMVNELTANRGSVQNITSIPKRIRDIYKTVWEIPMKRQVAMVLKAARYVDQSLSTNIHMKDANAATMTKTMFYMWRNGAKGTYYLRTPPAVNPVQLVLSSTEEDEGKKKDKKKKKKKDVEIKERIESDEKEKKDKKEKEENLLPVKSTKEKVDETMVCRRVNDPSFDTSSCINCGS